MAIIGFVVYTQFIAKKVVGKGSPSKVTSKTYYEPTKPLEPAAPLTMKDKLKKALEKKLAASRGTGRNTVRSDLFKQFEKK
jgi:hypothetical protein